MIYVGIDIAKLSHYTTVVDSDGVVLIELFEFLNDSDGFYMLLALKHKIAQGTLFFQGYYYQRILPKSILHTY